MSLNIKQSTEEIEQRPTAPGAVNNVELLVGLENTPKILPDPDGSLGQAINVLKMLSEQQLTKLVIIEPYPIQKSLGNGFRIEGKDKYLIVFKDEKEYFDGDMVAERSDLILAEGYRVNSKAVVLIGEDGVLALRKIKCGVEAARILPSGVGIVVTDDDKLLIMSKEGTKSKNFPFWSVPEEQRVITDEGCASIDEDENGKDAYVLRFFCFETQTGWRKKIKCSFPDDEAYNTVEPRILVSSDFVTAETPDGVVHRFSLDGAKL